MVFHKIPARKRGQQGADRTNLLLKQQHRTFSAALERRIASRARRDERRALRSCASEEQRSARG